LRAGKSQNITYSDKLARSSENHALHLQENCENHEHSAREKGSKIIENLTRIYYPVENFTASEVVEQSLYGWAIEMLNKTYGIANKYIDNPYVPSLELYAELPKEHDPLIGHGINMISKRIREVGCGVSKGPCTYRIVCQCTHK
jgi:Cysteine-rich secretory protein family